MASAWVIVSICGVALGALAVLFSATFWCDKTDDTSNNEDYKEYDKED